MEDIHAIDACKIVCCNNPLYSFLGWRFIAGQHMIEGRCENGGYFSSTMAKVATRITTGSFLRPRTA